MKISDTPALWPGAEFVCQAGFACTDALNPRLPKKLRGSVPARQATYDFIIAGAGSAGCVLANRLSANPANRVLLLEAGDRDESLWLRVPAGVAKVWFSPRFTWQLQTESQPSLGGRRVMITQGRTLGGSSSINGMAYVRGHRDDYETWVNEGATGWSWDDVLPYFRKSERHHAGESPLHGAAGELSVSTPAYRHPTSKAFIEAAIATGIASRPDFNDGYQEGINFVEHTIRKGVRSSTARAFLHPVEGRANLDVIVDALVERVIFDGTRAVGVQFRHKGKSEQVEGGHISLSAGALGSPKLLLLSGVGPADHLRQVGITPVLDLPGVGSNLQDHVAIYSSFDVVEHASSNSCMRMPGLMRELLAYVLGQPSFLAQGSSPVYSHVRSDESEPRPDLQIVFRPFLTQRSGNAIVPTRAPRVTVAAANVRPLSRGTVRLRSVVPTEPSVISPHYLEEPMDTIRLMRALKLIRRIMARDPIRELVLGEAGASAQAQNDAEIESFVHANADTGLLSPALVVWVPAAWLWWMPGCVFMASMGFRSPILP